MVYDNDITKFDPESKYRFVEKREFGEVCRPLELPKNGPWGSVLDNDLQEYNAQFNWISP